MIVRPYTESMQSLWDSFVAASRNATFIFKRGYMDYHADRFPDASLMLYDDHGKLLAMLPATGSGTTVASHAGLTYGGWIMGASKPTLLQLLDTWPLMVDYYRGRGYNTLLYKPVPHIYHSYPAEEDLYVLFRCGASLRSVLASTVVDLVGPIPFNTNAIRHLKHVEKSNVVIGLSDDFEPFWSVLENRLRERYEVEPVHTLGEIILLRDLFPDNIKLWSAYDGSHNMIAGVVLFLCGSVIKAQYIASSQAGRDLNVLDAMFAEIIKWGAQLGFRYLDLGPSCEDGGRVVNRGLVRQKVGYGGRTVAYTTYELNLNNI